MRDGTALVKSSQGVDWWWHLAPYGYGYEGSVVPLNPDPDAVVEKNRIEYVYEDDFIAWYINDEKGLEHGFYIASPPQPENSGDMVIEMSLDTSLVPEAINRGRSIVYLGNSGEVVLRYGKLLVTDATGGVVPSSIHQSADSITISIDDTQAVYPLTVDPLVTSEVAKLASSDGAADDQCGYSVSVCGNTVVVSACLDDVGANIDQGSVYVFERDLGGINNWGEAKKLTAPGGEADDEFGYSAAISGDTIVVGAWHDNVGANSNQGSAYIFERNQSDPYNWDEVKNIMASDGAANDNFGYSVSIHGDTIAVGAILSDVGINSAQGSAYIFERNKDGPNNWGEVRKLTASDGEASDYFGSSVAISGDTVVVGAYEEDVSGNDNGSAYIFERNQDGTNNWGEVKKLVASDGHSQDHFGNSVFISGDTIVVGAYTDLIETSSNQGSAYVFERNQGGAENWGEVTKLIASDGGSGDQFGYSVSISRDTIVIGALYDDGKGSVYIYLRNQSGPDNWGEAKKLTASDGTTNDYFGHSVSIRNYIIAVGAFGVDIGENSSQGSSYIYYINQTVKALNDSYSAGEDTVLSVPEPGVMGNDNIGAGGAVALMNTGPLNGTLSLFPNGSFEYTPGINYSGIVYFTYHIYDGVMHSDPATVKINVTCVNDPPVILTSDVYGSAEDVLYTVDYEAFDSDIMNGFIWNLSTSAGSWLQINSTTGELKGTPDNNHVGQFWVNVTVDDQSGDMDWTNFSLTVNNVEPTILVADVTSINEDELYSVNYDSDDDG
ncbi:MAG: cadherin-like domain-containing protein, partial [Thermoplasmata archaeon]